MTGASTLDLTDLRAAAARLAGVAVRTAVLTSGALDRVAGGRVLLKAEHTQRTGAFKFRGAYNRLRTLSDDQLRGGVIAGSSGNHAQALALAAALCGSRATVLMPHDAPDSKRAAAVRYGAEVIGYDRYTEDRDELVRAAAEERGATIVHGYGDRDVIAGAGTAVLELLQDEGAVDVLLVPVGGGGLLAGSAVAASVLSPGVRIMGVEPAASDDWQRSVRAGTPILVEVGTTIADGQQLARPGELSFRVALPLLEDIVTVTDREIVTAMRVLRDLLDVIVEPSGASALAALLAHKVDVHGQRVAVVLSGGNIDTARFEAIVGRP